VTRPGATSVACRRTIAASPSDILDYDATQDRWYRADVPSLPDRSPEPFL
jgi:hypothetical protein